MYAVLCYISIIYYTLFHKQGAQRSRPLGCDVTSGCVYVSVLLCFSASLLPSTTPAGRRRLLNTLLVKTTHLDRYEDALCRSWLICSP